MNRIFLALTIGFSIMSAQDDFVRGIMMFGEDRADFSQLADSLHLNWVQALVDQSNSTKDTSAASQDRWSRFLLNEHQKSDTVIHLKEMTIRFYGKDIDKLRKLGIVR